MAENCFECKNKIEVHSEAQLRECISKMSESLESVQQVQSNTKAHLLVQMNQYRPIEV